MKYVLMLVLAATLFSQTQKQEYVLTAAERIIKAGQSRFLPNTYDWVFEGDLVIEKGARLTIQPGTTLKFRQNMDAGKTGKDKNKIEVIVLGELIAEGEASADKFITFTSAAAEGTQRSGDWYGIYIYKNRGNENTKLKHCNINFAYRGITCVGSSPYIRRNQILYSYNSGIYLTSKSQATIESNIIQNNGYAGIEVRNLSDPKIYFNNITFNEYGIMVYDSSNPNMGYVKEGKNNLKSGDVGFLVGKNSITENDIYDIYNASSKDIYAQNNSWSSTQPKEISGKIYDRNDQSSYGRVIFEPIVSVSTAELQRQNLEEQISNLTLAAKPAKSTSKRNTSSTKKTVAKSTPTPSKPKPKATDVGIAKTTEKEVEKPTVSLEVPEEKEEVVATVSLTDQSMDDPFIELALDQNTGVKTNDPRPAYSQQIRSQNLKGRVIVLIVVGVDGRVAQAQILKSPHILLEEPALDAARKIEFTQGTIQGQPVQFKKTIIFKF